MRPLLSTSLAKLANPIKQYQLIHQKTCNPNQKIKKFMQYNSTQQKCIYKQVRQLINLQQIFLKNTVLKVIFTMNSQEMQTYKDVIPEFVFKLHHILEKNQYKDFITWANDGTQILIKNAKKLEDKVLPYFFRHKHLSSFIRQLNMYKFNKVNKIAKERSHMFFKNDYFKRGEFEQMKLIKRSQRPKKGEIQNISVDQDEVNMKEPSINSDLTTFKNESQNKFAEIQEILNRILKKNPNLSSQLSPAIKICQNMKGDSVPLLGMITNSMNNLFPEAQIQEEGNKNMLGVTVRDFPPVMNSMIYPSLCSLTNLDAVN